MFSNAPLIYWGFLLCAYSNDLPVVEILASLKVMLKSLLLTCCMFLWCKIYVNFCWWTLSASIDDLYNLSGITWSAVPTHGQLHMPSFVQGKEPFACIDFWRTKALKHFVVNEFEVSSSHQTYFLNSYISSWLLLGHILEVYWHWSALKLWCLLLLFVFSYIFFVLMTFISSLPKLMWDWLCGLFSSSGWKHEWATWGQDNYNGQVQFSSWCLPWAAYPENVIFRSFLYEGNF